jgi:two-component system response regulator NreC
VTLRILLAEDHVILRQGIRALIEQDPRMRVIGEAGDGRSAVAMSAELAPDVVLMDLNMPGLNGFDATQQICRSQPGVKVIGVSVHNDPRYVTEMLNAGASAYVHKEQAFEQLSTAIQSALDGHTYVSPSIARTILQHPTKGKSTLTPREREVLQLMSEGRATKEIAGILDVSAKTIETHRRQLMEKLDLYSVAELTKYALREGLTGLEQ